MSVVGPRPERPFFVEQFRRTVPGYMLRHKVKAGVTGWAQVNGLRGNTSLEKRIECDIEYIERWSLWLDRQDHRAHDGADPLRAERVLTWTALRRILFAAFVVGLGLSISLSESALAALTVLWLWRLRDPAVRQAQSWSLWRPMLAFSGVTVALRAPLRLPGGRAWSTRKSLLLVLALLRHRRRARRQRRCGERFLTFAQQSSRRSRRRSDCSRSACVRASAVDAGTPRWLFHRCYRARGPFSIYMTLAGMLSMVLLATLPRLLPGARRRLWFVPLWVIMLGGLIATFTRGAWLGFAGACSRFFPRAAAAVSPRRRSRRPRAGPRGGSCPIARAGPQHGRPRGRDGEGAALHVAQRRGDVAGAPLARHRSGRAQARVSGLRSPRGHQEADEPRAQHAAADAGRARRARPRRRGSRSGSRSTSRAMRRLRRLDPDRDRRAGARDGERGGDHGISRRRACRSTTSATPRWSWSRGP